MAIKDKIRARGAKGYLLLAGLAVVTVLLLIAACGDDAGEDRPGIEVIDTPTGSVSVSASGTGQVRAQGPELALVQGRVR